MNLGSFADELLSLPGGRGALVKVARGASMFERFGAIGAAAGAGGHALSHGKAAVTGDPWDKPQGSVLGAAARTGAGGLTAAAILTLLSRMASKGKKG
jgi:hypothetical protein